MTLAICHVTKRGEIAGPKALEHAVDCTILIRKAYNRRMVSVLKNRFGPETARPMQLEIDPITLKLRMSPHTETLRRSVARGYLPGAGLTEVQGAVALPKPGAAAKVTAPGLPRKEIEQYVSVYVRCRVLNWRILICQFNAEYRASGSIVRCWVFRFVWRWRRRTSNSRFQPITFTLARLICADKCAMCRRRC